MPTFRPRPEVEQEIIETLGLVPSFFGGIPDDTFDYEWTLFKRFELDEPITTNGVHIPVKYRQLMGVAVHSETKCEYCLLLHSELAKLFGASDQEVQEAVHYAKHTIGWSAYVNGVQEPFDRFAEEVGKIGQHLSQGKLAKAV